jgi:hypothetical protein
MHEFSFGSDSECMSFYVRQIQCLLPKSVFDVLHVVSARMDERSSLSWNSSAIFPDVRSVAGPSSPEFRPIWWATEEIGSSLFLQSTTTTRALSAWFVPHQKHLAVLGVSFFTVGCQAIKFILELFNVGSTESSDNKV